MASEAVVADHPIIPEQVKEELNEQVKTSEEIEKPKTEDSSPTAATLSQQVKEEVHKEVKTSEEVEKPKSEDSSPTAEMPLSESEGKIETTIIEELKQTVQEEKLKTEILVTPVVPLPEAEGKVGDKKIEPSVVEEEKKTVDDKKPIAAIVPTFEETPNYDNSVSLPVVLAASEEKVKVESPVTDVKQALEEVKVPAVEVVPSAEPELKVEDKNVEPPVVREVKIVDEPLVEEKIASDTPVVEEPEISVEPPVVEENIVIEPPEEAKILQTPVLEELKIADEPLVEEKIATDNRVVEEPVIAAEPPVVEENIVIKPSVEEKLLQTPVVEEAKDTTKQLVVEEKTTETPVVEEAKIAAEIPLLEGKTMIEPSAVEEKTVEIPIVKEATDNTETSIVEEQKNTTESPVVIEEKGITVPTPAEELKKITEPSVIEKAKHITEPPVYEVKNINETPIVVALVQDKSVVVQECTSEKDTCDVTEPEAKNVESHLVADTSDLPEEQEQKAESAENNPKAEGIPESSVEVVDKKEERAADLPVKESEPNLVKDVGIPEPQSIKEEVLELSTDVLEKPEEDVVVESKESVDGSDDIKLSKEEESTGKTSLEATSLVEATLPTKESQDDAKEAISGGKADLVEALPKERAFTLVKVEAETDAKDVKTDSVPPETKEAEEVAKFILTHAGAENISEKVITSKEAKSVTENEKEDKKSETASPVGTYRNGTVADKTSEQPDETKLEKPELKAKEGDTVSTDETKELDDKLTSRDLPKEEVTIKSTQKQSKTILSKVKNTLVKAKKAITGKSTNTKTPSSEPKGEIKA